MRTVVFRVDASARIGTGHVMRCLALAEELRARGAHVRFVCREQPGNLIAALGEKSFPVTPLPDVSAQPPVDAEQTAAALRGDRADWIIVDHYGLDAGWERFMRSSAGRILVIDDLANRPHDCDALLDQNYSAEGERRYAAFVPDSCTLLAGPRYALLAPEYAGHRDVRPSRDGSIRRVLVYFGGADASNMTGQALAALSRSEFSHLAVDLVIGTNHPQRDALERQAALRPGTDVHGTRPHLADLMVRADLAIGAGGITTWERMCLGVPSVVVSIASNQRPACEALAAAGLIEYIGDGNAVGAEQIGAALALLIVNRERLADLSSRGRLLVDGRGVSRVADVMFGRVNQ